MLIYLQNWDLKPIFHSADKNKCRVFSSFNGNLVLKSSINFVYSSTSSIIPLYTVCFSISTQFLYFYTCYIFKCNLYSCYPYSSLVEQNKKKSDLLHDLWNEIYAYIIKN